MTCVSRVDGLDLYRRCVWALFVGLCGRPPVDSL